MRLGDGSVIDVAAGSTAEGRSSVGGVAVCRDGLRRLGLEVLGTPEGRSNILTTFRLPAAVAYDTLHDALKRRGYIIYAGQGELRTYAFRVANMGTLTPRDMAGVVQAFASALAELGVPAG